MVPFVFYGVGADAKFIDEMKSASIVTHYDLGNYLASLFGVKITNSGQEPGLYYVNGVAGYGRSGYMSYRVNKSGWNRKCQNTQMIFLKKGFAVNSGTDKKKIKYGIRIAFLVIAAVCEKIIWNGYFIILLAITGFTLAIFIKIKNQPLMSDNYFRQTESLLSLFFTVNLIILSHLLADLPLLPIF